MKKLFTRSAIVGIALLGVAAVSVTPASAIVGGRAASQMYPGMAAMSIVFPGLGTGFCGATLTADPRFVLTAAHCVSDQLAAPNPVAVPGANVTIRVGSLDRTAGGVTATGARVYLHPDWAWGMPTGRPISDLALVQLDRAVPASLMLAGSLPPAVGDPARIIGWGLTEFPPPPGTGLPTRLYERDTARLDDKICAGGGISLAEVCLGGVIGVHRQDRGGACFGDSGGPALIRQVNPGYGGAWFQIGIVSRETDGVDPCGQPSIYTDTTYGPFRTWIRDTVTTRRVQPCTCASVGLAMSPVNEALMQSLKVDIVR